MYLVKIHNVYNYRNYHEFGKQDCLCACVYVWCVGPEPMGPGRWPQKPRTWGHTGATLGRHDFKCLFWRTQRFTDLYFRFLVAVRFCLLNTHLPKKLLLFCLRICPDIRLHIGEGTQLLWASVSISGRQSLRSKTSTTPGFLTV